MLERFIWLAPLLPWLAAGWIGIGYLLSRNRGEPGERQTAIAASVGTGLATLMMLAFDLRALLYGLPGQVQVVRWLASGKYEIWVSFTLDALGLALATLVALVSFLTVRFSVNYLHREAGFQRFFMVLNLFAGAMLLIVLAGNAALAFMGWEIAGLCSYLLIGYAYDRPVATENAVRAFVTNRVGDAGFVLGIFLSFAWLGGIEWPMILSGAGRVESLDAGFIAAGFLFAALAKAAQVPFSPWIARALEGPTPSSAIFYGSLMVHAGVYLVIRIAPLLEHAPALMAALAFFGLVSAVYGYLAGLTQTDVKSSLIFSTTAQVGLMFFACGMGWATLAAWYLVAHASWRAYQFLSAPGLMHAVSGPQRPVAGWLARSRWLYTASLQRFWLEPLMDALLVRPTRALARDVYSFDEQVVRRIIGRPGEDDTIASLAQWELRRADGGSPDIFRAQAGAAGRLLNALASALYWFEEHLVLRGGGERLKQGLNWVGGYLMAIDDLLSQPRYLLLMIMATLVVIL